MTEVQPELHFQDEDEDEIAFQKFFVRLRFCDDFVTTVATVPVKDFLTSVVYNSHESDHIRLNLCRGSFMSCRVKKKGFPDLESDKVLNYQRNIAST